MRVPRRQGLRPQRSAPDGVGDDVNRVEALGSGIAPAEARARIAAIQTVLSRVDYSGKDPDAVGRIDAQIVGGPEMLAR